MEERDMELFRPGRRPIAHEGNVLSEVKSLEQQDRAFPHKNPGSHAERGNRRMAEEFSSFTNRECRKIWVPTQSVGTRNGESSEVNGKLS